MGLAGFLAVASDFMRERITDSTAAAAASLAAVFAALRIWALALVMKLFFLAIIFYPIIPGDGVNAPAFSPRALLASPRLVVHEKGENDDDRQWHAQQPQQCASSEAHDTLHL